MSRHRFYLVSTIAVAVTACLLIGYFVWRFRASQNDFIEREQAIQNAIQACPYIGLQPVEQPTRANAELTTFGTVQGPSTSDPERPVWLVTIKGRWMLVGGPVPARESDQGPFYWDECTIIIDARTGTSLSAPIE